MATRAIARRRRRWFPKARRHAAKMTIPLAVVGGFVPLAVRGYNGWHGNGWMGAADGVSSGLMGYSVFTGKFEPSAMKQGLAPILLGFGVHWIAGKMGINRALGRAKVPFLRI